jgi:hypothetical protein
VALIGAEAEAQNTLVEVRDDVKVVGEDLEPQRHVHSRDGGTPLGSAA